MKKNIILFGALTMLAMASCNNQTETKEPVETTTTPVPTPPASSEKTTVVIQPASQKEVTTIQMNDKGISIENKDGSKKNNVKISKDSMNIEISRPK